MKDLINVTDENGVPLVSAIDLHSFLEIETPFTKWIQRMFEYGFAENSDYSVVDIFVPNSKGGKQSKTDYALGLDCAKEIAMIQRNEKGKEARLYFIEVEKKYQQAIQPLSQLEILVQSALLLQEQDKRLTAVETNQTALLEQVNKIESKQSASNEDFYTLSGYYIFKKRRFDLTNIQAQQTGKELKRRSLDLGYIVGHVHSEKYGSVGSYHIFILQAVLGF